MFIEIIAFIFVFGIIVCVHEYGHMFFAKRAGILVREFAIGMGPKIFSHRGKDGTLYSIRILPVGGYVRMAGWADDSTDIKKGTPASLSIEEGKVKRINLSEKVELENALPLYITSYDFDDDLVITGEVSGQEQSYPVHHDATIIEEDGTEVRIAPKDVQYGSASIPGRIITNFAGPLNNFILGLVVFIMIAFMQGGVASNAPVVGTVPEDMPAAAAGLKAGDEILEVNDVSVSTWEEVVTNIRASAGGNVQLDISRSGKESTINVLPEKKDGNYLIGVTQSMKTGFVDKIVGGFAMTLDSMTLIMRALGDLLASPDLDELGGPVAIFEVTGDAVQGGFTMLLSLLAMLSINIGIVNLLPIPFLDGGRILLNIIEAIRKKPLSEEREQLLLNVSAVFLIVLMIAVTWNDIMRAFN